MAGSRFTLGFWVGVILLVACALVTVTRLKVTTSITHFLVSGQQQQLGQIQAALADSELSRTMVFAVRGTDAADAVAAAEQLAGALEAHDEIAWVRQGVPEGIDLAVYDLYFPRRLSFMSDDPSGELAERLSDEGLRASAAELKRQLGLPTAPLIKKLAPTDPWLSFQGRVEALESAQTGTLSLHDGKFVAGDGTTAVLFAATKHSAFASAHQRPLEDHLQAAITDLQATHGDVTVERSAVHRLALASEAAIRADIQRISVLSSVLVVVFFVAMFRSIRILALAFVPLGAGVLAATAVGLLAFGQLHGLTLAFGATLIGVCIDYPVHFFTHHALEPDEAGPRGTLRRVWAGLALGALTSVAGFAGLAWASFPGIREIGVFASVGIAAAVGATRYLVPPLTAARPEPPRLLRRTADGLSRVVEALQRRPTIPLGVLVVAIAGAVFGVSTARFVDDARALNRLEPAFLAEDERVRELVSRVDASRLVVALGDDMEHALQRNDEVHRRLREVPNLEFRSLHDFVWSADLQIRNVAAVSKGDLVDRTLAALAAEGFRPEAFAALRGVVEDVPPPLDWDDLQASPLAMAVQPFRTEVGDRVAVLTFLQSVPDPAAVDAAVAGVSDVVYFDQPRFMADTYRGYRERTINLVGLGLLGVLAIVAARYRRPLRIVGAFAPALLAAGATLAIVTPIAGELNILHLVALLLVLSMGVDYGVFLAETGAQHLASSVLSIAVACVSTVFAFGLLALSSNPAMQAVGLTTAVGVLLSLVFAPITLVLTRKAEP